MTTNETEIAADAKIAFLDGLGNALDGVIVLPSMFANGACQHQSWGVLAVNPLDLHRLARHLGETRRRQILAVRAGNPSGQFVYLQNWPLRVDTLETECSVVYKASERGVLVDASTNLLMFAEMPPRVSV